jgi:tyrosine-protein phosphatase SIW14
MISRFAVISSVFSRSFWFHSAAFRFAGWLIAAIFVIFVVTLLLSTSLLSAPRAPGSVNSPAPTAPEGVPAVKLTIASLPNSACITPTLCRGAQPKREGYTELKKLGIEIVLDFRNENDEIQTEQSHVESLGMRFVSLPWSSWHNPRRDEVISFFSLLRENLGKKIFVHCEFGSDRTGLMIALYRLVIDHWTPDQAVEEMRAFNYHALLYSHLARYVRAFPARLSGDPELAFLISAPTQPPASAKQPSTEHNQ